MHRFRFVIMVALLVLIAGCAANQRQDSLQETLNAYHTALRWGNFQRALDFVSPDYRNAHPLSSLDLARYQQVRVVGYTEGGAPTPVGPDEVRQTVKIDLVNRNTQRERFILDRQVWKWDAKARRWWLTTGLPDITVRSAGT